MIELRDYQIEIVRQTHDAIRAGQRRVIICAPTGCGKRYLICWWAEQIASRGKRLLVITDRRILVNQLRDECKQAGIEYGTVMGNEPRNDKALVQIASIQTLVTRDWTDVPQADWIAHDECHKALDAAKHLQAMRPEAVWIGCSASPVGPKGITLIGSLYDQMIEPIRNSALINAGWLLKTKVWHPYGPDVKGVKIRDGEYNQTDLGKKVKECVLFADVFKWWSPYSDMQTIAFCPGVGYARWLSDQFRQRGYPSALVEAGTSTRDRTDYFAAFAQREIRVLCSVDVLREGFDSTVAQCGIDLQPNRQLRGYWQKLGRVKRPHEDQDHAVWLDFAGNFWNFPHPDDDPEWPVDETTTTQDLIQRSRERCRKCKRPKQIKNGKCVYCGEEYSIPWSCPVCCYSLSPWERVHDGKCPNCGAPIRKPIRRIRMEDGSMKSVSAEQKKKIKKDADVRTWFECLYPAIYSGNKLNLARVLFKKRTGRWPDHAKLPKCPEPSSSDWNRPAIRVFPEMHKRNKRNPNVMRG